MKKNKTPQLKNSKIIIKLLFLFLLGLTLTLLYIISVDKSFLVLSYNQPKSSFNNISYNKLLAHSSVRGSFQAEENNLGIVAVRFRTYIRPEYKDEDRLLFRVKEKNSKTWYYQNVYRVGLIYDVPIFPFGFPKISNSKGKVYQFEIVSLRGNNNNSVSIDNHEPNLITKYQESKQTLLQNKKLLFGFILKKIINALQNINIVFATFIFLTPFIFYLIFNSPPIVFVRKVTKDVAILYEHQIYILFLVTLLAITLLDAFYFQLASDLVFVVVTVIWGYICIKDTLDSRYSFLIGILFLLLCPLLLFLRDQTTANELGAWSFLFISAGLTISLYQYSKDRSR